MNVFDGDVYDSILYSPNYRIIEEKINRTFNLFGSDLFCVEFRLCLLNFLSLVSLFVSQENSIFQMAQSSLIVSPMVGIWTPIAFWNLTSDEFENFGIIWDWIIGILCRN